MCGVVGIAGHAPVNQLIYDALLVLQHRGQDAAGIATIDSHNQVRLVKDNGLVREIFAVQHMHYLQGNVGIGHVRYPTSGSTDISQAQPFYVNSPYGIMLAHNGHLTNTQALKLGLLKQVHRHINTSSDSEVLLNVLANELHYASSGPLDEKVIFAAIRALHQHVRGAYACVAMIIDHGMVAFRDPNGIRPLVLGQRMLEGGRSEYMVASESVALDGVGFDFLRDVAPGEAIYINGAGKLFSAQCAAQPRHCPCIFEFVYFARPDSFIDKISVYNARLHMGQKLGAKIAREWSHLNIDVVIPIPETSCDIALEIAKTINKPYRQGFVKNRYVGRTFIMPDAQSRCRSVHRKLNAIHCEFRDKAVLLVDDSIVRGTTSQQIVSMARAAGANKVYFASAAPEIRFSNVYGIDMPRVADLVAYRRDIESIARVIGADALIFQDLSDLVAAVRQDNPEIKQFETSVFNGIYITQDAVAEPLQQMDDARAVPHLDTESAKPQIQHLEIYNGG